MLAWISQHAVTILTLAVILLLVGAAVFSLVKDKKRKKGGCTGNCATCGMACAEHHRQT